MRLSLVSLLALVACGPGSDDTDPDDSSGAATQGSTGVEPTGGPAPTWQQVPPGCGGLNGVVLLPGGDIVVAGALEQDDGTMRPWVARFGAAGEASWSVVLTEHAPEAGFVALERVDDDVVAVGYHDGDGGSEPLLVRLAAADGAVVWTRTGEPSSGALYGAAWSATQARLWGAGVTDGAMLVGRYDGDGGLVALAEGPGGGGPTASVGFAVAPAGPDAMIVCGRRALTEGGQLWLGRYDAAGALQWSATGPDPGIGAYADCWDVAVGADQAAAAAESGYKGARIARYDAAGALVWEFSEPGAGAQAVDVTGTAVVVAGWSASDSEEAPMGLRSHETGERHGWLRSFDLAGGEPQHTWLGVDHFSPRDLKVHPDGGVVIVGQRLPPGACATPWIGRVAG